MQEQYQTIAKQVLADIEAGTFQKGHMLPKRSELAQRFGVARATVDRAIRGLVEQGVLESRRGSGTAVASTNIIYRLALVGPSWGVHLPDTLEQSCQVRRFGYEDVATKSQRIQLSGFHGILWYCPEQTQLAWARQGAGKVPQILLNRHLDDFNYVSTDHGGAIGDITARRLIQAPDAHPYFLIDASVDESIVSKMRLEGFVQACQQAGRPHEFLVMPSDFEGKIATLQSGLPDSHPRPRVLVSGALSNTGAVMAWAKSKNLNWKEDLLYSDFDDSYPRNVFGVQVTSFVQDYSRMLSIGIEKLLEIIKAKTHKAQVLVPPAFIDGET